MDDLAKKLHRTEVTLTGLDGQLACIVEFDDATVTTEYIIQCHDPVTDIAPRHDVLVPISLVWPDPLLPGTYRLEIISTGKDLQK